MAHHRVSWCLPSHSASLQTTPPSSARLSLPLSPGNMAVAGLLQQQQQPTVFMELGAGKAWLTAWLHMLAPHSSEFVLLDKLGNFMNKVRERE